jgi:hypothetical protein
LCKGTEDHRLAPWPILENLLVTELQHHVPTLHQFISTAPIILEGDIVSVVLPTINFDQDVCARNLHVNEPDADDLDLLYNLDAQGESALSHDRFRS